MRNFIRAKGNLIDEAAPNWIHELEDHPVLRVNSLFIPDLQVDNGIGWSPNPLECSQFLNLLQYRRKEGLKTFVAVQNASKLSATLAAYLHTPGRFVHASLGSYACPEHPEPAELREHFKKLDKENKDELKYVG